MRLQVIEHIDYGHRIHNHNGKCANIHGHTGKIVIEVQGGIDKETGMLIDFKDLKMQINTVISEFDHKLLLFQGDHLAKLLEEKVVLCLVLDYIPTAENLAKAIGNKLLAKFNPTDVDIFKVEFWETPTNCAIWELGK